MQPKYLFTAAVLLFVVASLVMLVNRESRESRAEVNPAAQPVAGETATLAEEGPPRVVVYYFHTRQRCFSCVAVEEAAQEAIREGFPAELEEGRLEWRAVNLEMPQNEHYIMQYQLTMPGLVVDAAGEAERHQQPRVLTDAWGMARAPARLKEYVQENVRAMLDGLHG